MLALGEETAVQAVVVSIVRAFRRLKKPRCQEMSARGYALHSVCPNFSFLCFPDLKFDEGVPPEELNVANDRLSRIYRTESPAV